MIKSPCVYMMASRRNGTIYIGVTSNVARRIWLHKSGLLDGFSKRYGTDKLVWFEGHETMESAIRREKSLKEWKRAWKIRLIESLNPMWRDLYEDMAYL